MKRDPIEQTQKFISALERIQPQLDKEFKTGGMGNCHAYWAKKKALLKKEGIKWKTPAECNPYILFD